MAIYIYAGEGAGKTTAALGLALRSIGHKHKTIILQFMKGRENIGEYKFQSLIKNPNLYKVYQFGTKRFVNLKNPSSKDKKLAKNGLEFIKEAIKQKPKLLILDEINLAAAYKLIDEKHAVSIIKKIPKSINVILTGRYAPKSFIKIADYVNEVKSLKMPKKMTAKKGIQC